MQTNEDLIGIIVSAGRALGEDPTCLVMINEPNLADGFECKGYATKADGLCPNCRRWLKKDRTRRKRQWLRAGGVKSHAGL